MADDIETKVIAFAKEMDKLCADWRKVKLAANLMTSAAVAAVTAIGSKPPAKSTPAKAVTFPLLTFSLSNNKVSGSRTPEEQALEVAKGRSWVCWGAHMANNARHVVMKADGNVTWEPKKVLGKDFEEFKKLWAKAMANNGLKNAGGGDGWFEGDELHLELPNSKMSSSSTESHKCLAEYARLTRQEGYEKNESFELKYTKLLRKHIEKAEKDAQ